MSKIASRLVSFLRSSYRSLSLPHLYRISSTQISWADLLPLTLPSAAMIFAIIHSNRFHVCMYKAVYSRHCATVSQLPPICCLLKMSKVGICFITPQIAPIYRSKKCVRRRTRLLPLPPKHPSNLCNKVLILLRHKQINAASAYVGKIVDTTASAYVREIAVSMRLVNKIFVNLIRLSAGSQEKPGEAYLHASPGSPFSLLFPNPPTAPPTPPSAGAVALPRRPLGWRRCRLHRLRGWRCRDRRSLR